MPVKPMLQLALDYVDLSPALAMAFQLRNEVEVIEIGTPLTKAEGMLIDELWAEPMDAAKV